MAKLVSKVYGEALFEVAVDHGNAIRLMNDTFHYRQFLLILPNWSENRKEWEPHM